MGGRWLVVGVVVMLAAACTSSGSTEHGAPDVTVRTGSIPANTGWLVGSQEPSDEASIREAQHPSDEVLLGLTHVPDAEDAGPPVVLRSTDEGRSWRRIPMPGPTTTTHRVLWADGGRAAVLSLEEIPPLVRGGTGVVRTSTDAGATWRSATVPDPTGSSRWVQDGRWWKGRWVFYGAAERAGTRDAVYSAIWGSADGQHLDFVPGVLPRAPEHVIADRITAVGDTLLATGRGTDGTGQTWRSLDGVEWTPFTEATRALESGPLVRERDFAVSLDGGRTWRAAPPNLADAARIGATWWFVQSVQTGEHTNVQRLVRTDDGGRHFRHVALPARPAKCRASDAPDQVLDPPRKVGDTLVVVSTCTPSADQLGPTGPTEPQILVSRDDGRRWTTVRLPVSARHGRPVGVTARDDHLTVVLQGHPAVKRSARTTVVTLDVT